ncbi:MAG: aminotransferase class V-fold PLP-dependent enzyme, partial [Bacteroidetes bacterium]|nr:aminotransferase class V-fold PLP-dependent enzyme [Bacteroidota bacterium]
MKLPIYLDHNATTPVDERVLARMLPFFTEHYGNASSKGHPHGWAAEEAVEQAREAVAACLGAEAREIIFTSGATAALNQIAFGLMHTVLQPGDRILLTQLEHHANIVPWQLHCQRHGIQIDVIPLNKNLQLDLVAYQQLLQKKPKVVSFSQVSNVLGHIQPVQQMVAMAKAAGAVTVIDGAQGVVYQQPDMQQLDCDFYVFSGHKIDGPTGTEVLYGKTELL